MATGVILNPWWEVPTSISKEVAGKTGYVAVKGKDGKVQRWRQPPGPTNALGQMKFVMHNPYNIYLHDTNARSRFNSRMRALSHGCIRTENILDLADRAAAATTAANGRATRSTQTLASKKTSRGQFREAAAGLHRLFQRRGADRRDDHRLSATSTSATPRSSPPCSTATASPPRAAGAPAKKAAAR